jgi:hypothetical protein
VLTAKPSRLHKIRGFTAAAAVVLTTAVTVTALPASSESEPGKQDRSAFAAHLSQSAAFRYYMTHPDEAPASVRETVALARQLAGNERLGQTSTTSRRGSGPVADVFNKDDVGLPQNEESVTACGRKGHVVLSGTNDYRGLLDPEINFTGWYLSTNGGRSVRNEGLLPALKVGDEVLPSGGDPVTQSDEDCNLYMASLNFGAESFDTGANGIGLYKTTPERLRNCPQGEDPDNLTHPSCWPTRRLVATAQVAGGVGQFLDKEWFDVGESGDAGKVVWVTFSDFAQDVNAPLGFTGAQIKAVRCDADLKTCTDPILISGTDEDIQFSDVTISDTGATLVTWVQVEGELEGTAQTFTVKARIAPAGSTHFGPTRIVSRETNPIPFGGFLHANDFRVATYPKSIMPTVHGKATPIVVWERCRFLALDGISCEEPEIVMSVSRDTGTTWSQPRTISLRGDNYFPAISDETGNPRFVVSYFTNRFDPVFHNRQDVEMVTINPVNGTVAKRQRVTSLSNESEADPLLGGTFIGDYIDVHLVGKRALVAYNANYRHVRLLGEGFPIPQQDNYVTSLRP